MKAAWKVWASIGMGIVSISVASSLIGVAHASDTRTDESTRAGAEARPVGDTSTTGPSPVDERGLCEAIRKVVAASGQQFAAYRGEAINPRQWRGTLVLPGTEECTVERALDRERRYACVHVVEQGEAGAEAVFDQYVGIVRRCLPNRKEEPGAPWGDERVKSANFYEPIGDLTSKVYVVKSYRGRTGVWYIAIYVNVLE
jgi:hypothetical protein